MSLNSSIGALGNGYIGAAALQNQQNANQLQQLQMLADQQQLAQNQQQSQDANALNTAIGNFAPDQIANLFASAGQNTGTTPPQGGPPQPPMGGPPQGGPPPQAPPPPNLGPNQQGQQGAAAGPTPQQIQQAAQSPDPFVRQSAEIAQNLPPPLRGQFYQKFFIPMMSQRAESQRAAQTSQLAMRKEDLAEKKEANLTDYRQNVLDLRESIADTQRKMAEGSLSVREGQLKMAEDTLEIKKQLAELTKQKEGFKEAHAGDERPLTPAQQKDRDMATDNLNRIKATAKAADQLTAATGIAGRAMAASETFGQYFGSNQDSYNALAEKVRLLRETMRLPITGSVRETKEGNARLDAIIPLLQPFTTKQKLMEDLKQLNDLVSTKYAGILKPRGGGGAAAAAPDPLGIR